MRSSELIVVFSCMMFVHLPRMGVHCDHMVHFSTDLSLQWMVQCSGHPDTKACPPTSSRLFPFLPGREVEYGCAN